MPDVKYSVDRFEGDVAVLVDDDGHSCPVPVAILPADIRCGDVLNFHEGVYTRDAVETDVRRSYALSLQEKLRRKQS